MIKLKTRVGAGLFLVFSMGMSAHGETQLVGRVVAVVDGDTITLLDSQYVQHKIRLAQIDAPEKAQPFGNKAKQSLSDLVFGREASVNVSSTDRYGRMVGMVIVGETNVNAVQVERGMAWVYRRYMRDLPLIALEKKARDEKRGLWVDEYPTPPWEFRRR